MENVPRGGISPSSSIPWSQSLPYWYMKDATFHLGSFDNFAGGGARLHWGPETSVRVVNLFANASVLFDPVERHPHVTAEAPAVGLIAVHQLLLGELHLFGFYFVIVIVMVDIVVAVVVAKSAQSGATQGRRTHIPNNQITWETCNMKKKSSREYVIILTLGYTFFADSKTPPRCCQNTGGSFLRHEISATASTATERERERVLSGFMTRARVIFVHSKVLGNGYILHIPHFFCGIGNICYTKTSPRMAPPTTDRSHKKRNHDESWWVYIILVSFLSGKCHAPKMTHAPIIQGVEWES